MNIHDEPCNEYDLNTRSIHSLFRGHLYLNFSRIYGHLKLLLEIPKTKKPATDMEAG
jgi:hypothetical protein